MAGPNFILDKGFLVNTGQVVTQFTAFKLTDKDHISVAGAGEAAIGVVQELADAAKIATGKLVVDVRVMGITKMVAGVNNITIGQRLTADSLGRATQIAATVGEKQTLGVALSPSTAVGDWIDVLLTPFGVSNTAVS